jgi:hypothetical protein
VISFQISLHKKDINLLELIRKIFNNVGVIHKQNESLVQYRVTALKELTDVIITHFDKYFLIYQKNAYYILFKKLLI